MTRPIAAATAAAIALLTACSPASSPSGPEQIVFATSPNGISITGQSPTGTVLNFSNLLYNSSRSDVQLQAIQLVSPSNSTLQQVKFWVYQFRRGVPGIFEGYQGKLWRCTRLFAPVALSNVNVGPRSYSRWNVVLSFIAAKPGTYKSFKMKLEYLTEGHRGWQYFYLNVGFKASLASAYPRLIQPFACGN